MLEKSSSNTFNVSGLLKYLIFGWNLENETFNIFGPMGLVSDLRKKMQLNAFSITTKKYDEFEEKSQKLSSVCLSFINCV